MKKVKFVLPAYDAEKAQPIEVGATLELSNERAEEAVKRGLAVYVDSKRLVAEISGDDLKKVLKKNK